MPSFQVSTSSSLPKIHIVADRSEAEEAIAKEIAALAGSGVPSTLGLATGNTMRGVYARLAERKPDFSRVTTFNLDEYRGLSPDHPASFREQMRERLFRHLHLVEARTHFPVPRLESETVAEGCARYEAEILQVGGIDVQLLGVGSNGHLAFNEPGSARHSRTREVELAESTRQSAAPSFAACGEQPPERAWTMGVATILTAKSLRVLAFGAEKADIVAAALQGPIGPDLPASFVRTHPSCEVWLDQEAAGSLRNLST